jgi:predicted P-loop ATPase
MADVVKLPVPVSPSVDEHTQAETQRDEQLFAWADAVLKALGLDKAVAAAKSVEELRRITFDTDSTKVITAIRNALHPTSGRRQEHFSGLREGGLKIILKNRFAELKKTREVVLRRTRQPEADWTVQLILDKNDKIVANLANLILILRHAPKWRGVLSYDEFSARTVIKKRPPWGEETPEAPWIDHHDSLTRVWFQREQISPSMGDLGRAVQAAARHNPFHPVREYFDALVWDGVPRLVTWLVSYFHAEDSDYVRAIGLRYLISAVARIYRPGCKVDHVLVLEGPQGKQKSEALRRLVKIDAWFTDRLSHVASKDAALEVIGVLLVEIAEMDALTKATTSAIKSFLTRRRDRLRPPYGRHTVNHLRQCVFAATINPPAGGYLKDPTGARRFWPVACHGMIDIAGLEAARDQLWAEAVHRFKAGAPWWLETPELEALATAEQAARFVVDAWEEPIRAWLGDRNDISLRDVLKGVFGLTDPADWTPAIQKRVGTILTKLGFEKRRPRTSEGGREHRYYRDPPLRKRCAIKG